MVSESKLVSNMALGREVLDSSTLVVLVGWRFRDDSIADNTALLPGQRLLELAQEVGLRQVYSV